MLSTFIFITGARKHFFIEEKQIQGTAARREWFEANAQQKERKVPLISRQIKSDLLNLISTKNTAGARVSKNETIPKAAAEWDFNWL